MREHSDALGDIPPEIFRKHAHEVADWIADFLTGIDDLRVFPDAQPGAVRDALPHTPPMKAQPLDDILRDFREILVPGMTHWNHPNFHAYFSSSGSGPGILAEALCAAINNNAMVWRSGPASAELEGLALDWLRQMLGLPDGFEGHINDTASVSNLVALAAAREQATDGTVRTRGLNGGPQLRLYASEEAHSSVDKAALILGLGTDNIRKVAADRDFRMIPEALEAAIADDRGHGHVPMAVVATVGTTSTTSIDPVPDIARICKREDVWLHVDAAYGGSMGLVPEFRYVLEGCDQADSFVVNPHKWMFVPIDCSAFFTRKPEMVRRAFSLVAPYLMTPEDGHACNLMDYGPAMGRRFRSLKLWMVFRAFGAEGLAARIRAHVELAREFASWVEAAPGWERMAPAPMSLVLFRHAPSGMAPEAVDAHNRQIMDRANASGRVFMSHTVVHGRFVLRMAIGNLRTTREHVANTWALLQELAES